LTGAKFIAAAALLFAVALSTPADATTPSANGVEERGSAAWFTSPLVTTQLEEPDTKDLVKMKAAVHAAAQIKKTAISMNHLPTQDSKVTPAPGPRGRAPNPIDPALFKAGPYIIASGLVAICLTFTYCACSGQPTSMSGKYDMTGRGRGMR